MARDLIFLDFNGLEDHQERELLMMYINPSVRNPSVELPWDREFSERKNNPRGSRSVLNVHAPSFHSKKLPKLCVSDSADSNDPLCHSDYQTASLNTAEDVPMKLCDSVVPADDAEFSLSSEENASVLKTEAKVVCDVSSSDTDSCKENCPQPVVSSVVTAPSTVNNEHITNQLSFSNVLPSQPALPRAPFPNSPKPSAGFKLCGTVSSFIPQNIPGFASSQSSAGLNDEKLADVKSNSEILKKEKVLKTDITKSASVSNSDQNTGVSSSCPAVTNDNEIFIKALNSLNNKVALASCTEEKCEPVQSAQSVVSRSFADVLKSTCDNRTSRNSLLRKVNIKKNENDQVESSSDSLDLPKSSIDDDKYAIHLGKYFYYLQLDFSPLYLQPRGLINRRNWCYINATLQALLACPPFYRLLRNLPNNSDVDRGKSATPVIDSMVNLAYEFSQVQKPQDDMKPGLPFQPSTVYDMLCALKSDCLKGQQEDAEEFLSYILNGMHEEIVSVIKYFEKKHDLHRDEGIKTNGHIEASDGEDEWQVIGVKQRGMITRKVAEHKTPISDLLGGQIKSFLTTNGKTSMSASVQPFFTLQLDIQAENVTSVEEALDQMTIKEPIQGYTCAKTKQEVEAFSRILLQKLPPILILHLKRFVYNKNGGCKKILKLTEYPINLELKKDLFSTEAKKSRKPSIYKLFAVMYHDGEEAVKGHYISDIYHHGSHSWIRCDDRNIAPITETQVLSHSPPRVPYLLFYQVNDVTNESAT